MLIRQSVNNNVSKNSPIKQVTTRRHRYSNLFKSPFPVPERGLVCICQKLYCCGLQYTSPVEDVRVGTSLLLKRFCVMHFGGPIYRPELVKNSLL